jgi:hypothetical protein
MIVPLRKSGYYVGIDLSFVFCRPNYHMINRSDYAAFAVARCAAPRLSGAQGERLETTHRGCGIGWMAPMRLARLSLNP